MSAVQALGAGAVALGLATMLIQGADRLITSSPSAHVVINSLRFEDGNIVQDRTILADADVFHMAWSAKIENEDGTAMPWCSGSGAFGYATGRAVVELPLKEWTGRTFCTADSLPPGTYTPIGTWLWGDNQTSFSGEPFVIE